MTALRMAAIKRRQVFEEGHRRKYLVIADETEEVEAALFYAALRAAHTEGSILLLYVIEPQEYQHWVGVRQVQLEEETNKAKALFRLFRRKLNTAGFESVHTEEVIREGKKAEAILELIDEDEDVAVLTRGAATDTVGPGPLVSSLAAGTVAGSFPIPITIVPGNLTLEELQALA